MLLAADGEGGKAALLDPGAAAVGERLSWSGLEAAEPATLNVKDFAKIELKVSGGNVSCLGRRLESSAGAVLAAAPDGAAVH